MRTARPTTPLTVLLTVLRVVLAVGLAGAGTAHLTVARTAFRAQVPGWVPLDPDLVVVVSGVVELVLAVALVAAPRHLRPYVGLVVAVYFVAIFPGNVAQYLEGADAFGLDTDRERAVRLAFQPVLVAWAVVATRAWSPLRPRRERV